MFSDDLDNYIKKTYGNKNPFEQLFDITLEATEDEKKLFLEKTTSWNNIEAFPEHVRIMLYKTSKDNLEIPENNKINFKDEPLSVKKIFDPTDNSPLFTINYGPISYYLADDNEIYQKFSEAFEHKMKVIIGEEKEMTDEEYYKELQEALEKKGISSTIKKLNKQNEYDVVSEINDMSKEIKEPNE